MKNQNVPTYTNAISKNSLLSAASCPECGERLLYVFDTDLYYCLTCETTFDTEATEETLRKELEVLKREGRSALELPDNRS